MLNDLYHMLDPVAISAGPITIYWYGLAYVVGALLTAVVMYRTQRRWGFNITIDDLTSVVVGAVFGLIIGARLFYVVFYGDGYYWAHPLEIFATNEGGMSFHGGLVGGILGGISTGQDIHVNIAIKPTSSIATPRRSIDIEGNLVELATHGRHDPCVGLRAAPIAEAMLALVLIDHALRHRAQNADVVVDTPDIAKTRG